MPVCNDDAFGMGVRSLEQQMIFSSLFHFSVLSVCFLIQQEYQPDKEVLSPAAIEKMPYQKVERQSFLSKEDIVADPEEILKELCELQQKSWQRLTTVKGRAWKSFFRDGSGNVVQLQFAASRKPKQEKEFIFYTRKRQEAARKKIEVDFSGIRPDDLESLFCLSAKIRTSEFVIDSTFIRNLREDITDSIAIENPEKIFHTSFDVWNCQFGFNMSQSDNMSPVDFFEKKLANLKKHNLRTVVMKKGDLVELELWTDLAKDQPYRTFLFDMSKNGSAVYNWSIGAATEREFVNLDDHWLPSKITSSRSHQYAELQFFGWQVNSDCSKEFSISSLPATKNAFISDRRNPRILPRKIRFKDFKDQQK